MKNDYICSMNNKYITTNLDKSHLKLSDYQNKIYNFVKDNSKGIFKEGLSLHEISQILFEPSNLVKRSLDSLLAKKLIEVK